MADELNVQAQQGINPLWPIGAAAVGGAGTYYGVNKYASAPYKSIEDLVKEKEDTFNGKLQNATEQQKTLMEKAKAVREQAAAAGTKYDADLAAYQEANKFGVKETPEFQELVKKQQEAEKVLADKRAELEKIGSEGTTSEVSPKAKQALDKVKSEIEAEKKALEKFAKGFNTKLREGADKQFELVNEVESLQEQIRAEKDAAKVSALKTQLAAKRAELKTVEKELDEMCKEAAETMITEKGTKSEIAKLKEAKANEIRNTVYDIIAERTHNESIIRTNIKEIGAAKKEAFKKIKTTIGEDLAKESSEEVERKVGRHIKVEQSKLAKLEKFKELFAEAENKVKLSGGETTLNEEILKFLGLFKKTKTSTTVKTAENMFAESLTTKEAEDFLRLVKGGSDAKAIDKAIAASKERIQTLETATSQLKTANAEIVKLGGEGAYIKSGRLYGADGKVVKFKPEQIKLANDVEVPATRKLRSLEAQQAKIEADIAEATGRSLNAQEIEARLANEVNAVNNAKAAVEKARGGLEKTAERSAEDIAKEFVEKNGSKEDFVKKAVEKSESEIKALFEKKWGNGKIAGVVAAGTVLAGLIGYAIAPKRNS